MYPGKRLSLATTRSAKVSDNGRLTIACSSYPTPPCSTLLTPVRKLALNCVGSGRFVTYFSRPPSAVAPYTAPCRPRSTSTRATSHVSRFGVKLLLLAKGPSDV